MNHSLVQQLEEKHEDKEQKQELRKSSYKRQTGGERAQPDFSLFTLNPKIAEEPSFK